MSKWDQLVAKQTTKIVDKAVSFVGKDAWDLVSDEGKQDVVTVAALLVECQLLEAAGETEDAGIAKAALQAALGNWETSGRIRASTHADEFVTLLKVGLVEAAEIGFKLLGASVRGLVLGM